MGQESFILSVRGKEAQEPPELGEEGEKALICPFTILTGLYRALAVCQAPRQVLGMPRGQGRGSRMNRSVLPRRCPAVACGSRRGRPGSRPWPQRAGQGHRRCCRWRRTSPLRLWGSERLAGGWGGHCSANLPFLLFEIKDSE